MPTLEIDAVCTVEEPNVATAYIFLLDPTLAGESVELVARYPQSGLNENGPSSL
jgi:hypothetical protein